MNTYIHLTKLQMHTYTYRYNCYCTVIKLCTSSVLDMKDLGHYLVSLSLRRSCISPDICLTSTFSFAFHTVFYEIYVSVGIISVYIPCMA